MINTKLPAPVSTATLPVLLKAIEDPGANAASIADAVSHDMGLVSRVLGLANSAQFGLSRQVSRLDMAVGLVGTSMVQTLAIANAAALLSRESPMADRQQHAFEVAVLARHLASDHGVREADAFAAGLLHDVGELLLYQAGPHEYVQLRPAFENHDVQLRVEKNAFGTDHALLGAEHLLDWRVPDVIADAVADHHRPLSDAPPSTLVVAAADELVDADPTRRTALDLLGIDPGEGSDLLAELRDEALSLAATLVS